MAKKSEPLLRETRPTPPWRLALSALAPFALGLVLVGATFGEEPDETGGLGTNETSLAEFGEGEGNAGTPDSAEPDAAEHETTEPEPAEVPADEGETELEVLPADLAMGGTGPDTEPELDEAPVVEAPVVEAPVVEAPVVETPPRQPSNTRFERGRLAYLRCGSMAGPDGRCPRDRDLEDATWSALEGANHCGLGAGSADVRLHFSGGAPELRFRDYGDPALELGALQTCLGPHVAALRSTLPQSFVLSMRFTLR